MEMNVRRSPPTAQPTPVVLDAHERARTFPPPGRISPKPDHGRGHPQVIAPGVDLDDVPRSEEEHRTIGIVVRTNQSNARRPGIGAVAHLDNGLGAVAREPGVEPCRCRDAALEQLIERGDEALDRSRELLATHCRRRKFR